MKKRIISFILAMVMVIGLMPTFAFAANTTEFAGGSGTASDPYLISTKEHLDNVRLYLSSHFKMINDIIFDESDFSVDNGDFFNNGIGWKPIGTFTGTFDGNYHSISNLFIDSSTDKVGLFSEISNGFVKNVNLIDASITGKQYVGAICGYLKSSDATASITNCYVGGKIVGNTYVGGICGYTYGVDYSRGIEGSSASANTVIMRCYNDANVIASSYAGGITSSTYSAGCTISNCVNSGSIQAKNAGGILGNLTGDRSNSWRKTGMSVNVQYHYYYYYDYSKINDCYNFGIVEGGSGTAGGILGQTTKETAQNGVSGGISECYNIGTITGAKSGDIISENNCPVSSCYSLSSNTDEELQRVSTYSGWDFETVWTFKGDSEYLYPELQCFTLQGSVTIDGNPAYGEVASISTVGLSRIPVSYDCVWYVDGVEVSAGDEYSISSTDIGKELTVKIISNDCMCEGSLMSQGCIVGKGQNPSKPDIPKLGYVSDYSFEIDTTPTQEYSIDNTNWQSSGVFENLEPNKEYTVYSRILENDLYLLGKSEAVLTVTTDRRPLTGVVNIVGIARYGDTLTADTAAVGPAGATFSYEWKRGNEVVGTDASYTIVKDDIGQNIILSVKGTDDYIGTLTSAAVTGIKANVQQPDAPVAEETTNTSIKLIEKSGYEYSKDKITWQDSPLFEDLSVATEYTFYQRIKETETAFASKSSNGTKIVTLKNTVAAPEKPIVENVTNVSVTLKAIDQYEYSLDGITWQRSNIFDGLNPNEEYSFCQRISENETTYASPQSGFAMVTTLKNSVNAPSAPIVVAADDGSVTLLQIAGYEYSKNGTTWQKENKFSGLDALQTYTFYQRVAETETDYASPSSEGVKFKVKYVPSKPVAPVLKTKTNDRIEVQTVSGYQYSIDGTNWRTTGIFTGLQPNKDYTVYCRTAENDEYYASVSSDALKVTTLKNSVAAPDKAPVVLSTAAHSITLSSQEGYEYSTNCVDWQTSNVFEDLVPNTEYKFYQRVAETDTTYASQESPVATARTTKESVKAPSAPVLKERSWDRIELVDTIGYEYSIDGVTWQESGVFEGLKVNTEYNLYQRIAETETEFASANSAPLSVRTLKYIAKAPKEPVALTVSATTITLAPYTNYEYSLDGINWQKDNHFVNLTADTAYHFCQRSAETEDTYQSGISGSVEIRTFKKAACSIAPVKPIVLTCTSSSITLMEMDGYEYSENGTSWQSSPVFSGLNSNTSYTFYQRIKETADEEMSVKSAGTTAKTISESSGQSAATNYDKLRTYINNNGSTNSDGNKNILGSQTSSDGELTVYYTLENTGEGIEFSLLTASDAASKLVGITRFTLLRNSKYISVYGSLLYYDYYSLKDSVTGTKSIDRSGYTGYNQYTMYNSGTYISSSIYSDHYNSTLKLLCTYFDAYIYSKLGFGLKGLGFTSYSGNGTTVCDSNASYHTGSAVKRNAREAGCIVDGYTGDSYCGSCNTKISSGTTIASKGGHTYSNACDKSCDDCGEERRIVHTFNNECDTICNVCGLVRDVGSHIYDSECDATCNVCVQSRIAPHIYDDCEDVKCNGCDYVRTSTHLYEWITDKAETCGDKGSKHEECTVCHKQINQNTEIPATGKHTPAAKPVVDVEPTCTATGTGHTVCVVCNQTLQENVQLPIKGHGETEVRDSKAATCTNVGYSGDSYCKDCGEMVSKGSDISKVSHKAGAWVVVQEATTSKTGLKEQRCTVCNELLGTEIIAKKPIKNPFTDVKKSDFYYEPVLWAVSNGITSGTSKTTFAPNEACTRGQIATFLWRAAGCPAPKTSKNPFTDVKKSDYYYKAVLWAVGEGITSGTSKTTFGPNEACTRGQIATFLWRANGGKKVSASNPFKDVKKSDYYYNAVLWAVKNKITSGTSSTTFSPNEACTRGQIATFLYRSYN